MGRVQDAEKAKPALQACFVPQCVRPLPCQLSSCDNSGDRIATSQPFLHPLPLHEYNFLFILIHPAACGPA